MKKNGQDGERARWTENQPGSDEDQFTVVIDVPQGWILGPVLFNTFINDQHSGAEDILSKFAGDTKLGRVADMAEGPAAEQSDLQLEGDLG